MRAESINYWINKIESKHEAEPQNKEEQSVYDIAEFLVFRQKEKSAA